MSLRLIHLAETDVEFGDGTATTIKEGLAQHGPYSLRLGGAHPASINIGIVGPPTAVDGAMAFLDRCTRIVPSGRPNRLLAPDYPGFKRVMRADLNVDPRWTKPIDTDLLDAALKAEPREAFRRCLDLWRAGVAELAERDTRFDVIVCALPKELIDRCGTIEQARQRRRGGRRSTRRDASSAASTQLSLDLFAEEGIEAASQPQPEDLLRRNFRRALKAAAMEARVPIQIVTPGLYQEGVRRQQDPATRAWNLTSALFYKAGGIPWRASPEVEHTCFVGISFHHLYSTDSHTVFSSLAQAFSSDGEGFALRGEPLPWNPDERRPQLGEAQIERLLTKVLVAYRDRMDRDPLRVVVHKTSKFSEDERTGARRALSAIPAVELRTIRSTDFRLLRQGTYPPHRGTLCRFDTTSFLYTTGYAPERATYEGPHIPVPLELVDLEGREAETASREILGLTKMNWNSTRDHSAFPISLAFARQVGLVMSEVAPDRDPHPAYRFYM